MNVIVLFDCLSNTMKKYFLFLFVLAFGFSATAQDDVTWKQPSKESEAYHDYRFKLTKPPYGLQKILTLLSKLGTDDNDVAALPEKTYASLSLREKFTYHMIHGESYSQNCDIMPPIEDEQKKIFAELPDVFGEFSWSARQKRFLKDNRDSVIEFMRESIVRTNRVGLNFKLAIVEINAKEMVPLLIDTYNHSKKDHDILTVFMLLMKNNKYEPFLASSSYKKLYADEDASYKTYLNYNASNEELVIKRVTEFNNGSTK